MRCVTTNNNAKAEPLNIFQAPRAGGTAGGGGSGSGGGGGAAAAGGGAGAAKDGSIDSAHAPIRLSFHNNIHYNCITDPHCATFGVGLGFSDLDDAARKK